MKDLNQEIFNYFVENHNLTLCESEMNDIKNLFSDNWISVKDRLPDCTYLTFAHSDEYESGVAYGFYDGDGIFYYGSGSIEENVTHWQPLPEPPIKEKSK